MDFITYRLSNDNLESDEYYLKVDSFTSQVLIQAEELLSPYIGSFQSFLMDTNREIPRTKPEYYFELLVLGTLWRVYGRSACSANPALLGILSVLSDLRQRSSFVKPGADFLRGILLTVYIAKNRGKSTLKLIIPDPNVRNFRRLLKWLLATGEFSQEVIRLNAWQDYFKNQPPNVGSDVLNKAIEFAFRFEKKSQEILGKYTINVKRFLSTCQDKHRFREDIIFRRRQQLEYHLNMVGAEIMNRAFRREFLTKERKVLILPSCMRDHTVRRCKAIKGSLGSQCMSCTPGCCINKLTKMGVKHNFEVYTVSHESSVLANYLEKSKVKTNMGVIGVACVLNLIAGGWKVKALGIPPQCVLLNYCGCKRHWHDEGIPTDININQLLKILAKE